jgi:hypothetical protein
MRRTWIGAAVAAALTTVSGTALAIAQETQQQNQAPANHRLEKGQQGQTEQMKERTGQQAQAQAQMGQPGEQQKAREGEQSGKPRMKGEAAAQGEKRANQAQSETPNRALERNATEKGAQIQERKGEVQKGAQTEQPKAQAEKGTQSEKPNKQTEKGAQPGERTGQAGQMQNRQGEAKTGEAKTGEAKTGQGEMQNRTNEAATGQNEKGGAATRNVQAMGNAHISQDHAVRIAQTLMATSSSVNRENINISVGVDLPGNIDVLPLPPDVVELVPEYRDYDYVVVNDEIAIVQPSTRRVVEIIREGGGTQAMNATHVNPCGP